VKRLPIDTYEADYEGDAEDFEEPTGSELNAGRIGETTAPASSSSNPNVNPEDLEGERSDEGSNPGCPPPSSNARVASSENCESCGAEEYRDECGECRMLGTSPPDTDGNGTADCLECEGVIDLEGNCCVEDQLILAFYDSNGDGWYDKKVKVCPKTIEKSSKYFPETEWTKCNSGIQTYYLDADDDKYYADIIDICPSLIALDPMYKTRAEVIGEDCDDTESSIKDQYYGSVTIEVEGVQKDTHYFHTCDPHEVELTASTNPAIKNTDKIVWSGAASGTGESMTIDRNNVGEIYVNICDQRFQKIKVTSSKSSVLCTEVHFSGNDYYELKSDDVKITYDAPQWTDNDRDGNMERHYGVAYKRDTKPKLKAHFYSKANIQSSTKVYIKATGTDGVNIPQTEATVQGNEIILGETEASKAWVNAVKFYDKDNSAFELKWEIKIGNCAWKEITTTKHQVYITLDQPSTPLRQETLFKVACDKSSGASSDTSTVKGIWSEFTDRKVINIDGEQLAYWKNDTARAAFTDTLLMNANGQCGLMGRVFNRLL